MQFSQNCRNENTEILCGGKQPDMNIRQNGIYYTSLFNPFSYLSFKKWIKKHNLANETILEPFAGSNSIIKMLQDIGIASKFQSFDLYPQSPDVVKRNTLTNYPKGYTVCITNPPWLYKSSARRRKLHYPKIDYDDLYKLSLSLALSNNQYVAALVPASFIQSRLFQSRLEKIIFLNKPLFTETQTPVCLALFGSTSITDIQVYNDDAFIGNYSTLKKYLPPKNKGKEIFNSPYGSLGLFAIDNTSGPSIRFCQGSELEKYVIRNSSRSITRIEGVEVTAGNIGRMNTFIQELRETTKDIFLTSFKGLRKDGRYRRRLDYTLARDIINFIV